MTFSDADAIIKTNNSGKLTERLGRLTVWLTDRSFLLWSFLLYRNLRSYTVKIFDIGKEMQVSW